MTDISNIKITIAFTDTDLDDDEKNQEVQKLLSQMQKLDEVEDVNRR
jgi:transcriptional/translational regulatory protein YebC/TACO1